MLCCLCAAEDASEADLISSALMAIVHGGTEHSFNGPFVIMFFAYMTNQTQKLKVHVEENDGVQRLRVELARSWRPPQLSFSVLTWSVTQVRLTGECHRVCLVEYACAVAAAMYLSSMCSGWCLLGCQQPDSCPAVH